MKVMGLSSLRALWQVAFSFSFLLLVALPVGAQTWQPRLVEFVEPQELGIFDFTVYSVRDIEHRSSDFQGVVGAGGSVVLRNFGIADTARRGGGLVVGGDLTFNEGGIFGPLHVDRRLTIANSRVQGISTYGSGTPSSATVGFVGGLQRRAVDRMDALHSRWALEFESASYYLAALRGVIVQPGNSADGSYFWTDNPTGRALELRAYAERSVFHLDGTTGFNALTLRGGPRDLFVVNIRGASLRLVGLNVTLDPSMRPDQVVFNFPDARDLEIAYVPDGVWGIPGTVLAPCANVSFYHGLITGGLYAGNLIPAHHGQVNAALPLHWQIWAGWCREVACSGKDTR